MDLTLNDFFCGAGGMGLGFQNARFRIVGSWDWDKYAVQSYAANVGDHVKQANITEMKWNELPKASVWTFGFPCQDLSIAGQQAGMKVMCNDCSTEFNLRNMENPVCPQCDSPNLKAATRSGLFFEMMRLLVETRENAVENMPAIIMAENVKGLAPYLPTLQREYERVGYTMTYQLFNSKHWGVPQSRERYYVVGIRNDLVSKIHFEFPGQRIDAVPRLSSILEPEVAEKYYMSDDKAAAIIEQAMLRLESLGNVHATLTPGRVEKRQNGRRAKEDEAPMFTLTAQDIHGIIVDKLQTVYTDKDGCAYCCDANYYKGTSPGDVGSGRRTQIIEIKPDSVAGTLIQATADAIDEIKEAFDQVAATATEPKIEVMGMLDIKAKDQCRRVYEPDGLSPTLTAVKGGYHEVKTFDYTRYRVRKLTPREYARLQGFPERYNQVVSDSQFYKQLGNAVTVNVAEAIATRIAEALEGLK